MGFHFFSTLVPYFELLAIVSVVTFIGSLIIIPVYIGRLPSDFFLRYKNSSKSSFRPLLDLPLLVIKNIVGIIFLAAGIIMLFLPGQGILTIFIGLLCISLPGKRKLIIYLIRRKSIQNSLDWTRKKLSKPVFTWP